MIWLLLACAEPLDAPVLDVYPNADLMTDGHVDLPEMTGVVGKTPIPVDRFDWRDGFSVAQTTVFKLDQDVDPSTLDGVQVWDLTAGAPVRSMAELDAFPQDVETPSLLVRPLEPFAVGHTIAVVITDQVTGPDGAPLSSPEWFTHAIDGGELNGRDAEALRTLVADLEGLGVQGTVLATSFPVGDARGPLRSILDQAAPPSDVEIRVVRNADDGDEVPPGGWLLIEGSFEADTWLQDDAAFVFTADGTPELQGRDRVDFAILVPDSARQGPTDELWVFGHGIFSQPTDYLGGDEDSSAVVATADLANAVVIGTYWRGLCRPDLATAVGVGNDFGRLPELTNKLVQGVANNVAMVDALDQIFDQPETQGLWDGSSVGYYGISLGGIEGAVFMANQDVVQHGVLHVGGSAWSTMLERSSNWSTFEDLVVPGIPSAWERQLYYAVSQLSWDYADPATYAVELQDASVLWQISVGDEQVPNMTSDLLTRGAGATQVEPLLYVVDGLESGATPLSGPAVAQFDPERSMPEAANRPGEVSGAHGAIRHYWGTALQTERFLRPSDPGVVEHFCGDAPCAQSNQGDD